MHQHLRKLSSSRVSQLLGRLPNQTIAWFLQSVLGLQQSLWLSHQGQVGLSWYQIQQCRIVQSSRRGADTNWCPVLRSMALLGFHGSTLILRNSVSPRTRRCSGPCGVRNKNYSVCLVFANMHSVCVNRGTYLMVSEQANCSTLHQFLVVLTVSSIFQCCSSVTLDLGTI